MRSRFEEGAIALAVGAFLGLTNDLGRELRVLLYAALFVGSLAYVVRGHLAESLSWLRMYRPQLPIRTRWVIERSHERFHMARVAVARGLFGSSVSKWPRIVGAALYNIATIGLIATDTALVQALLAALAGTTSDASRVAESLVAAAWLGSFCSGLAFTDLLGMTNLSHWSDAKGWIRLIGAAGTGLLTTALIAVALAQVLVLQDPTATPAGLELLALTVAPPLILLATATSLSATSAMSVLGLLTLATLWSVELLSLALLLVALFGTWAIEGIARGILLVVRRLRR